MHNIQAVIKFQAASRGFFSRKAYRFKSLSMEECTDGLLSITGNDPDLQNISKYPEDNKIVLIGTSGLRSLKIACELGGDCTIFLIDNSRNVIDFWKKIKKIK